MSDAAPQQRGTSIFVRLLMIFLSINIFTSVALLIIIYGFIIGSTEKRVKESVTQQLSTIAIDFQNRYSNLLRLNIKSFAAHLDDYLFSSESEQEVQARQVGYFFLKSTEDLSHYEGVSFIDREGNVKIATRGNQRNIQYGNYKTTTDNDQHYSASQQAKVDLYHQLQSIPLMLRAGYMDWFIPEREIETRGPFLTSANNYAFVAGLAKLDLDTGKSAGALIVQQDLSIFFDVLREFSVLEANPIWILSPDGQVLQSPNNRDESFNPVQHLKNTFQGTITTVDTPLGFIVYQDFSIVPGKSLFRVAVSVPIHLLRKDFNAVMRFLAAILLVSVLILFVVSYLVSRYLSTPIISLAKATEDFATGVLKTEVAIDAQGEVGTLVRSFNFMIRELKNKEQLEQRVEDRTRDLAIANSEIIAQREAEKQILKAKEEAEKASRAKSEFLAVMSHEIRTPMNGVIGMADLLKDTGLNHEQADMLNKIEYSGNLLLSIINDILDYSKIEAGKLDLHPEIFDCVGFIKDLSDILQVQATAKDLDIISNVSDDVPEFILADPGRLGQVLTNLIGNAIKFSENGQININVKLRPMLENERPDKMLVDLENQEKVRGNQDSLNQDAIPQNDQHHPTKTNPQHNSEATIDTFVLFEVMDYGIGIAPADQAELFEAFSQVDYSTTRKIGGTGLGLAISKALVASWGGTINVVSQLGQGSKFWFTLPLVKPDAYNRAKRKPLSPKSTSKALTNEVGKSAESVSTMAPFNFNILLVEDNIVNQSVAKKMLCRLGCTVELAENGLQALNRIKASPTFDIVLMDCQMPIMDGYTATRKLREYEAENDLPPNIVIALTANVLASDQESCRDSGMNDFLPKPLKMDKLTGLLDRWLHKANKSISG